MFDSLFQPPHTAVSVSKTLAAGLADGTVTLNTPLVTGSQTLPRWQRRPYWESPMEYNPETIGLEATGNFFTRLPGGMIREIVNDLIQSGTWSDVNTHREILVASGGNKSLEMHSALYLDQTPAQFFAVVDECIQALGIPAECISELCKTEVEAPSGEERPFAEHLYALYGVLRRLGYSPKDLAV